MVTTWLDDCIGVKLAVNKRHVSCVYVIVT